MSEAKTKEQLRDEYFQLCAQAGELQYKIEQYADGLKQLNGDIARLNKAYTEALKTADAPQGVASVQA